MTYAIQNRDSYRMERLAASASPRSLLLLSLAFCLEAARHAREPGGGAFTAEGFAKDRAIPRRFVQEVIDSLVSRGVLAEVKDHPGEYLLYREGAVITWANIARAYLDAGESPKSLGLDTLEPTLAAIDQEIERILAGELSRPLLPPPAAK